MAPQRVRRAAVAVGDIEVYLYAYDSVAAAKSGIGLCFAFYYGQRLHATLDRNTPDNVYFNCEPLAAAA
jgi:putative transposase